MPDFFIPGGRFNADFPGLNPERKASRLVFRFCGRVF